MKLSDAITYDDSGKVIPLPERFNENKKDIRYSFGDESVDLWGVLDPEDEEEFEASQRLRGYIDTAGEILDKTRGVQLKEGRVRQIVNSVLKKYSGLLWWSKSLYWIL